MDGWCRDGFGRKEETKRRGWGKKEVVFFAEKKNRGEKTEKPSSVGGMPPIPVARHFRFFLFFSAAPFLRNWFRNSTAKIEKAGERCYLFAQNTNTKNDFSRIFRWWGTEGINEFSTSLFPGIWFREKGGGENPFVTSCFGAIPHSNSPFPLLPVHFWNWKRETDAAYAPNSFLKKTRDSTFEKKKFLNRRNSKKYSNSFFLFSLPRAPFAI